MNGILQAAGTIFAGIWRGSRSRDGRKTVWLIAAAVVALALVPHAGRGSPQAGRSLEPRDGAFHVYPGDDIQAALDAAGRSTTTKHVKVHEGTYRPDGFRQALVWLNARHDGVTFEAVGDVTLTASNPEVARNDHHTAVVNHVIYIGDGVGNATVVRGFRITGADNFTTRQGTDLIEPNTELPKSIFFYVDGGGVKIYGQSYPTLERIEVVGNYTSPCGGGVSIEHHGEGDGYVIIRDSIFRNNSTQVTGSAVDVLPNSRARISNSLFVGNVANTGLDYVSWYNRIPPYNGEHGSGALTVFEGSHVIVTGSTFTDNWNAVDDRSTGSRYADSIFWMNNRPGGISPGSRYELDVTDGSGVTGNFINGDIEDLQGTISRQANVFDAPDPRFDGDYVPQAPEYEGVGYRPVSKQSLLVERKGLERREVATPGDRAAFPVTATAKSQQHDLAPARHRCARWTGSSRCATARPADHAPASPRRETDEAVIRPLPRATASRRGSSDRSGSWARSWSGCRRGGP